MKTQLIQLPDYNIIVSDEEIKKGDLCISMKDSTGIMSDEFMQSMQPFKAIRDLGKTEYAKKIIASENPEHNLPSIDYSSLSDEDCRKIGYVDVEKLAEIIFPNKYQYDEDKEVYDANYQKRQGFIEGFKKAQSFNDKKFSLEDVKGMQTYMSNYWSTSEAIESIGDGEDYDLKMNRLFNQYIQSLQQPKKFNVEVEMKKYVHLGKRKNVEYYKSKITNNKIKIVKIL